MSSQARKDMVGGGERKAIGLEKTWWGEMSNHWAQKNMVEAGDEQLCSD